MYRLRARIRLDSRGTFCGGLKAGGHEPFAYLRHVFERIPSATTVEEFERLLPWNLNQDLSPMAIPPE
ncbi:MAG: transposase domain-containing protein [Magnetococcales bacterium]|nr:transposase domain-containing protein [Magnetococcales bacterium]